MYEMSLMTEIETTTNSCNIYKYHKVANSGRPQIVAALEKWPHLEAYKIHLLLSNLEPQLVAALK